VHITEKAVLKLQPGEKREQFKDDQQIGFGVRVDPDGRKSFYWFRKIHGVPRFRPCGEFPKTSVIEARREARRFDGIAAEWERADYEGEDPFARQKKAEPAAVASVPTFSELVESYIQKHVRLTANRPERAEYDARLYARKYFGKWTDRPVDSIIERDVLEVRNACGERLITANRCVEFIRRLFNWSTRSKFFKVANPAEDIEKYPEKERTRFLQPKELPKFNEVLEKETNEDLKDFLVLSINTGARKSDVLSMRWQDIDWEREVWSVPYPKNGESYDVSLLPAALVTLKRRAEGAVEDAKYVFPGVGRTGHLIDLKKPWEAFRKKAGIPDIRVHDVRRSVGSFAAMAGMSLPMIGQMLGHKSLQATKIYSRFVQEPIRDAREAGQAKMISLMQSAAKRAKTGKKLLTR
jgi:integrase